jgi:hypothetical protein
MLQNPDRKKKIKIQPTQPPETAVSDLGVMSSAYVSIPARSGAIDCRELASATPP